MKKIFLSAIVLLCTFQLNAQQSISFRVRSMESKEPLAGATVTLLPLNKKSQADSSGLVVFHNLAPGTYKLIIQFVGFVEKHYTIQVPQPTEVNLEILMEDDEEEEEEVIISATRTSRSISDIPTRIETIGGEEINEKANMKPGEIRMLLSESTGIQTQQTSATSYNSSIRIQGLDGRYTQVLRDGFPLYSGFSGGLSLMQIPPLDLKQVEVIKGSTSTLYGGGAIAGLVNLVSKTPTENRELSFLTNISSAGGLDLSGFYSEKYNKSGLTVFGSRNSSGPYDPAGIGFTAIPKFERYSINPRLFFYGKKIDANVGLAFITENRTGGSMEYIRKGTTGYFEKNQTDRFASQADIQYQHTEHSIFQFKNSFSGYNRRINVPGYTFEGFQVSSYSEVNFRSERKKSFWILGLNFLSDDFNEEPHSTSLLRDYHYNTYGAFIQNTWRPGPKFSLESGLRVDYVRQYGMELLPRLSAMYKPTPRLTIRLGGGRGYKTPTVFNEDAERLQFQKILPVNQSLTQNERSAGGNLDFNFRTHPGEVGITINQLFFYTRLNRPLVLNGTSGGEYEFLNANGYVDTRGMETNLRISYRDFKLFIGYTYAEVHSHFNSMKEWFPLTPRHRLNNVLMYERDEKLKIGLEAYYFSSQVLSDGAQGKAYWITGLMIEKLWNKVSVFINFENILDSRQTRFDTIFTGSVNNPVFRDIYAPVDGFVVNGGFKFRL